MNSTLLLSSNGNRVLVMKRSLQIVASMALCVALGCGAFGEGCRGSGLPIDLIGSDGDGIPDDEDNCPMAPNGPEMGTCVSRCVGGLDEGAPCFFDEECGAGATCSGLIGAVCVTDEQCDSIDGAGDGSCSLNQEDFDEDGAGDACDNCPPVANGPAAGTCINEARFGIACTSDQDCETELGEDGFCSLNQEDSDDNGIGDACPPDDPDTGRPGFPDFCDDPALVQVNAGPDRTVDACQLVTLQVTTLIPSNATVSWAQTAGPAAVDFTLNGDGTASFVAPASATNAEQNMTFRVSASSGGVRCTDSVIVTVRPFAESEEMATRSTGATQPGRQVTISLSEFEPATRTARWARDPNDPSLDAVPASATPLTQTDPRSARFTAPEVAETTMLKFLTAGCDTTEPGTVFIGAVPLSVQVAQVTLDLSSVLALNEGDALTLTDPDLVTLTGIDPDDAVLLFFADDVDNGGLPPGVEVTIDNEQDCDGSPGACLRVTRADQAGTLTITVRVFATAGELDSDSDTLDVEP